ncbi:MAG: PIN domain-containing protein [archaeon]|nr:PIN domain-containing protein [archaeon]
MYFFDSYALIEIIRGNFSYEKYKVEVPTCTILNLFELHQALVREFNKQTADYWIKRFNYNLIEITKEDAINASDFKFANKDKKLSTVDCIGYVVAIKNKLKFLTGDKEFAEIDNVEYIK